MTIEAIKTELKKITNVEIFSDQETNGDMTLFFVCPTTNDSKIINRILFENVFNITNSNDERGNYIITLSFINLKFDFEIKTNRTNENYTNFGFLKKNKVHFINTLFIDINQYHFIRENRIRLVIPNP